MADNRKFKKWQQYTDQEMAKDGELDELHQKWNESIAKQAQAAAERQAAQYALSRYYEDTQAVAKQRELAVPNSSLFGTKARGTEGISFKDHARVVGETRQRKTEDWASSLNDEDLDAEIKKNDPGIFGGPWSREFTVLTKEKKDRELLAQDDAKQSMIKGYDSYTDEDLEKRAKELDARVLELENNGVVTSPEADAQREELEEIRMVQEDRASKKRGIEEENARKEYQDKRKKVLSEAYAKGENVEALLEEYRELISAEEAQRAAANAGAMQGNAFASMDIAARNEGNGERKKEVEDELKSLGVDNLPVLLQYTQELKDEADTKEMTEGIRAAILAKGGKGGAAALGYSALDVLAQPIAGAFAAYESLKRKTYPDPEMVNTSSPWYSLENMQATTEQATNQRIDENTRTLTGARAGQFFYNAGMSGAKSAETALIGGGVTKALGLTGTAARVINQVVTLPTFGTDAYARTLKEEQDRGVPTDRAMKYALASGMNEMLFEVLSMDKFYETMTRSGAKAAKGYVKNAVKDLMIQSGIEGSEELATNWANRLSDELINHDDSEINRRIKEFMDNGYTMEQAKEEVWKDILQEDTVSFLSAAVSAGPMTGAATAVNVGTTIHVADTVSKNNPKVFEKMRETAKNVDPESAAYQIANSEKKTEELTKAEKGEMLASLVEQQEGNIETVLEEHFEELGESKEQAKADAQEILAAVEADPETVSEEESEARAEKFEQNENLSTIYGELARGEIAPVQQAVAAVDQAYRSRKNTMDSVKSVQKDSDGNFVLKMKNGSTVRPQDMNISEQDYNTRMVMGWAMEAETPQEATQILQNRPEDMPYPQYRTAFEGIKNAAMTEIPLEQLEKSFGEYTRLFSPDQVKSIYYLGENLAKQRSERNLTGEQMKAAEVIAKAAGIKVQIGGRNLAGSNGIYSPADNTIYISDKTLNPAAVVAGHELVHSMKQNANDLYQKLNDTLVSFWKETDPSTYQRIYENRERRYADQVKEWKENGRTDAEIEDLINEEIVAHATEALFEKWGKMSQNEREDVANRMAEKDRSLAERILDFVRDLLEKFKKALQGYKANSLEARTLKENIDLLENFEDVFMNALQEYGERNKASGQTGELVDARGQEATGQQSEDVEIRHSKKNKAKTFEEQYDAWDKVLPDKRFTLGTTSNALRMLGVKDGKITMDASKIIQIKSDHPEMSDTVIKMIPRAIGDPIIIMDSVTVPGRLVLFGDLYADNGDCVMVAIEPNPKGRNGAEIKEVKVASAYSRTNKNIQNLVNKSNIRYINPEKNKTNGWIARTRVQFPVSISVGSNGIVTSNTGKSNKNAVQTQKKSSIRKSLKEVGEDSEGKKLTADQIEYFKDSKIVDEQGRLRVVYHGTNNTEFNIFDPDRIGASSGDDGFFGRGFYFAYSRGEASYYGSKRVIAAYVNVTNPFDFQKEIGTYNDMSTAVLPATYAVDYMNFAYKFPEIADQITIDVVKNNKDTYEEISLKEFADAYKEVIESKEFELSEAKNEYGETITIAVTDPYQVSYEYDGKKHSYKDYKFNEKFQGSKDKLDRLALAYSYLSKVVYDNIELPSFTHVILDYGREFTDELKKNGYDGVIQSEAGDEVVAFYQNQIKNVDNEHPTADPDIRYSIKELPDGETYIQLDGNLYDDGHGGRLTDVQAYDKLVNTIKYILLDGEKVFFIKYLKNKFDSKKWDRSIRKELLGKWPYNTDGISDMQTLNDKINENIVELLSRSEMEPFGKDAPDENGKHAEYGIESFDNRFIRFADENDTYRLELTIAKLDDGRKIAYSKKTIERDPLLKRKIEEGTQGVIPIAPTSKKTIPSSKKKSNNNLPMKSKKELDEIDEVFEAEAKRLGEVGFMDIIRQIDMKEVDQYFKVSTARKVAKDLIDEYSSSMKAADLAAMIQATFAHWAKQGNKADYKDIVKSMVGIARPLMDQTKIVDNATKAEYDNLRAALKGKRIRLSSTQKEELRNTFDNLNVFRGKLLPYHITIADDGIPLDSIWSELVPESGYFLDESENEGNMPIALLDTLETLKPKMGLEAYKVAGMDENEMAVDIALDIYGRFMKAVATDAENKQLQDKIKKLTNNRIEYREDIKKEYQRKYEDLKRRNEAKMTHEREIFEWELAKKEELYKIARSRHDEKQAAKYQKSIEYYKNKLEETRKDRDEKLAELRARYRNNNAQRKVNYEIQQKRASVIRTAKSIGTLLSTNTDKKHVPEVLKQPVYDFIAGVQYFGKGHDGPQTKAELEWADRLEKMRGILGNKAEADENGFTQLYHTIMDQSDGEGNRVSSLLNDMDAFLKNHGTERMMDMGADTLTELNDLMKGLKRAIDNMNQLYVNKHAESVAEIGDETIKELAKKKSLHNMTKLGRITNELLNVSQLDAGSFFRRFGEAGKSVYRGFRDAQNSWIRMNGEAMDYMKDLIGKTDVRKWATETHDFEFGVKKVSFTTAQIMSIYELMKRKQAEEHIIFGGIKPADFQKGLVTVTQDKVRVTPEDVAKITDVLTDDQKRIADGIQHFMNVQAANWGNKTTMLLYGYRRFLAGDYFPISVDKDTTDMRETSILNGARTQGFTKETKEHAKNALMAKDIFDVFTEHVAGMATYAAYSPALMDARKWHDYRLMPDSEILEADPDVNPTIQGQIRRVYGADMLKYFENLIADINNERKADTAGTGFYDMFLSNAKAAAIAGNVRVVIQQPTAYARALAVIDPKYLAKAIFTPGGAKRAIEHSAIAKWKSDGHWETGIAASMKSEMTGQKTIREKINEVLLFAAGKADDLTWGKLWNAVELETKDLHPNVDPGSKEFYKLCEERFDDVIDQTQVVDTTLHRSQIMRSKNGVTKALTSFMAEPTKSYNLLMNRVRDWYEAVKMGDKKAAKKAAAVFTRAAGAFLFTAALNAAAQSLWDAVRGAGDEPEDIDDPKERWSAYWKRFIEAYVENITDNVNPLNLIPYAKDLISIMSGYTSNNLNAQGLEKTVTGATKLIKWFTDPEQREKTTFYDAAKPLIQGLSYIGGVPFYNVMRDTVAVFETLTGKKVGGRVYTASQQQDRLANAALEGDMEKYNEIVEEMPSEEEDGQQSEHSEAYIESTKRGLNVRYKVGDVTDEDYIEALKNIGMTDDEAWMELQEQKYKKETGEKSYSAYRVLADPLLSGDTDAFEKIKKEYLDHGMEEDKIKTNTAKYITEQVKAEIAAGTLDADAQAKYLTMYQKLGYDRDKKLKDIKKWRSEKE